METSSSKMNYVPKKFTSTTAPSAVQNTSSSSSSSSNNSTVTPQKPPVSGKAAAAATKASTNVSPTSASASAVASNVEKCVVCEKTVYAMEKIEADKKVYHKLCFKCTSCNCTLK